MAKYTFIDKDTGKEKEVEGVKSNWEHLGISAGIGAGTGAGVAGGLGSLFGAGLAGTVTGGSVGALLGGVLGSAIGGGDEYKVNNLLRQGTAKQLNTLIEYVSETGKYPSKEKMEELLGGLNKGEKSNLEKDLKTFLSKNNIEYESLSEQFESESGSIEDEDVSTDIIDELLMTDPYGERANQYRNAMYNSINQYEQDVNATLASTELDAYRLLGQQQLELENQIASQRMQAIKSGVTSAQLASQELANMFAAQSAASQIAQQTMSNRAQQYNTIAQQRASVEPDLYNMINSNQATGANVYAQLQAAQQSYNSYMNQPFAQYQAALAAYYRDPDAYKEMFGIE